MRILVDTSVWSLALRKLGPADHEAVTKLTTLLDSRDQVLITGLILQEVLQACRNDRAFQKLAGYLEPFQLLTLDFSGYLLAARIHRTCRSKGISASTADCQIAAAAIENECLLLTSDRDFERIAKHCSLKLV